MFFWRGWGISVLLLLLFWLIVAVVVAKSVVPESAGNADADTVLQWLLAIALVLDGASVFLLDRYRKSHPRKVKDAATGQVALVAHGDHFSFIPFGVWTYILFALAAVVAAVTALGYRFGS
ncbi:MAG: hypothetical protein M0T84_06335 [Betaproteobacteria bacterium]|nr:hypothetical protein [Betaproteobacteria bacterium]